MPANLYRVNAVRYDGDFRFLVPSRQPGEPPYLVELDSYNGNGQCICKDFTMNIEKYLKQGTSPEKAVADGHRKVPAWGTVEDSLRCFHVHVARLRWADLEISAQIDARKTHSSPAQR